MDVRTVRGVEYRTNLLPQKVPQCSDLQMQSVLEALRRSQEEAKVAQEAQEAQQAEEAQQQEGLRVTDKELSCGRERTKSCVEGMVSTDEELCGGDGCGGGNFFLPRRVFAWRSSCHGGFRWFLPPPSGGEGGKKHAESIFYSRTFLIYV